MSSEKLTCSDCMTDSIGDTCPICGAIGNPGCNTVGCPDNTPTADEVLEAVGLLALRVYSFHDHDTSSISVGLPDLRTILASHAAQAQRIGEAEAERDKWQTAYNARDDRARDEADALKAKVEALEAGMRLKLQYPQAGCPGIASMCPEENPEPGCVLVRDLVECWVKAALAGCEKE